MASQNGIISEAPKPFHGPWNGPSKIVVGIDLGTTQSGVAFSFLQQGASQVLQRVTQWPGQEAQSQQSKIPTLVWYDADGKAVSFGAEALSPQAEENAEDNHWQIAKHFKLHLHPDALKAQHDLKLDPLPHGVSLHQVYSDFLGYLIKHTQAFFEDRIIDGKQIWATYKPQMEIVMAHPNGWGIRQQTFLRTAAISAGLVSAPMADKKVRFVSEAEASVHFCIYHTSLNVQLQAGERFVVCDAGGSTVDTTVYSVVTSDPIMKLVEVRESGCVQAGAIFIDAGAEKYLRDILTTALLDEEDVNDYTARGVKDFERSTKRNFCDPSEDKSIEIAGSRFNNSSIRTRRGRMTLPGAVIKLFFDPCVNDILASVDDQIRGVSISYILLVGGLGNSPFLRQKFRQRYESQGCQVALTNESTSKAVADGAVIWSTTCSVTGRAPRSSFGIEVARQSNQFLSESRQRQVFMCASGYEKVPGGWQPIVAKGAVLDVNSVNREGFSEAFSSPNPDLGDFELTLFSYSNDDEPQWTRDEEGAPLDGFQHSCVISADLNNLRGALEPRIGIHGSMYWRLYFDVCMRFGGTELEAYLEWEEKGAVRRGAAIIVPDAIE